MQKIYCYVDETGQDTRGDFFLVSVVVTETERKQLTVLLTEIESVSGKGKAKWIRARHDARMAYINAVLGNPAFKGKLNYAVFRDSKDYMGNTVIATARAITSYSKAEYKATIFVDGLPKSQIKWFGAELRKQRIRTRKVRGVRKEESDALIRLADALAGFVRAALSGKKEMAGLLEHAKRQEFIQELSI